MTRLAIVALVALVGCIGRGGNAATESTFTIAHGLRPQVLAVPADAGADLAACVGARVFVPLRGGVVAAGWNGWLVEPSTPEIESVACDEDEHVYGVSATGLSILADGAWQQVATLPQGAWHVVSSPDSRVWVWGQLADGTWAIHQIRPDGIVDVYAGPDAITAATVIGRVGLLAAIAQVLFVFGAGGDVQALVELDAAPDGLAALPDGTVFVSLAGGIVQMKDATSPPATIATGVHGALAVRPDTLYVRSVEEAAVIRLSRDPR